MGDGLLVQQVMSKTESLIAVVDWVEIPLFLPTYEDVLRCCSQERFKLSVESNNKRVRFLKVASTVARNVNNLFEKASVPTVSECRLVQLITAFHEAHYKLRKSNNRDKKQIFKKNFEILK